MRRGEVWTVELDPVRGSEASKTRRCVIVSRDASNKAVETHGRGVVTVVPLTSSVARVPPFQALVPAEPGNGLDHDSKAQAEQVRAVDVSRMVARVGTLRSEHVGAVDDALITHLGLD
ncbi:transcriptional modulator of MazE/toxin, MazF [Xylanimonas cellulosilytica DSM 15894]|uniref:mRNA interferase n=1 Tax=Xylanimonas cellulosilytica (strain DSM 15894 / JCM 12276 / CECT 5975 / KCTC 9989 / LMG 20990 / NBRC 107835 / XIL07) TaxID=446471 RepID=D1BVL1_XYLCX|nr:type II toxin-antitoxin system PemK/MazF family toxin [Xylanimonas cellulosilytica]ACZ31330.1 transcriptional modulator of MazE/toxin, MazF [Xylanimonas cellulosilytica DSM 15894]